MNAPAERLPQGYDSALSSDACSHAVIFYCVVIKVRSVPLVFHKLMNYIRYWQASGESAKTSVRIKTRMHQLVEEGYFTRGVVPFGYDLVKKEGLIRRATRSATLWLTRKRRTTSEKYSSYA